MVRREPRFELTGGRLCLDLANTVDRRPTEAPQELLATYEDLLAWTRQSGLVSGAELEALHSRAERRPREARGALARVRALRETLFQIFTCADARTRAARALDPELTRAYRNPGLRSGRLAWEDDRSRLDFMLGPVVRSAVDLLGSPELERVRRCAAEDCDWLFIDESRNRSRQWCDMAVCGNRAKARRFYRRSHPRPRSRSRRK